MYRHTLVIGGTGMLRAASVELASRSRTMTSVARTERSLAAVNALLSASSALHHMLALDWSKPEEFLHSLRQHLVRTERPDLVVAWIHDDELAIRVAGLVATQAACRFFHVVGSAGSDPSLIAANLRQRLPPSTATYHQVILGHVRANGGTRWLTNEEISAGVLSAIARAEPEYIVGTIQPGPPRRQRLART